MTKAQIVQRLLEEELINAEEAVILLQPTESIPFHTITYPHYPYWVSTTTDSNPDQDITKEPWAYPDTKFTPPSEN